MVRCIKYFAVCNLGRKRKPPAPRWGERRGEVLGESFIVNSEKNANLRVISSMETIDGSELNGNCLISRRGAEKMYSREKRSHTEVGRKQRWYAGVSPAGGTGAVVVAVAAGETPAYHGRCPP